MSSEDLHTDNFKGKGLVKMNTQTQQSDQARTRSIFGVMIMGALVAFLNQTLINIALPQMMDHFHVTAATGNWLTTIFMLVNGIVIPITAFLMNRFTTRRLYITAMGLFTVGTLLCGIAPTFSVILVGRVVQAAGAGILFPLITNVIFTLFPPDRRLCDGDFWCSDELRTGSRADAFWFNS